MNGPPHRLRTLTVYVWNGTRQTFVTSFTEVPWSSLELTALVGWCRSERIFGYVAGSLKYELATELTSSKEKKTIAHILRSPPTMAPPLRDHDVGFVIWFSKIMTSLSPANARLLRSVSIERGSLGHRLPGTKLDISAYTTRATTPHRESGVHMAPTGFSGYCLRRTRSAVQTGFLRTMIERRVNCRQLLRSDNDLQHSKASVTQTIAVFGDKERSEQRNDHKEGDRWWIRRHAYT